MGPVLQLVGGVGTAFRQYRKGSAKESRKYLGVRGRLLAKRVLSRARRSILQPGQVVTAKCFNLQLGMSCRSMSFLGTHKMVVCLLLALYITPPSGHPQKTTHTHRQTNTPFVIPAGRSHLGTLAPSPGGNRLQTNPVTWPSMLFRQNKSERPLQKDNLFCSTHVVRPGFSGCQPHPSHRGNVQRDAKGGFLLGTYTYQ